MLFFPLLVVLLSSLFGFLFHGSICPRFARRRRRRRILFVHINYHFPTAACFTFTSREYVIVVCIVFCSLVFLSSSTSEPETIKKTTIPSFDQTDKSARASASSWAMCQMVNGCIDTFYSFPPAGNEHFVERVIWPISANAPSPPSITAGSPPRRASVHA